MIKLLAVDGNSILNRGFYGLQGSSGFLKAADGTPTNAVYAFINIFLKQCDELKPDAVCVAFDMKAPTFRHEMYEGYKASRKGMPDELAIQLPIVKEILSAMNIEMIESQGYEADDILGTVSRICDEKSIKGYLLTGDRDSLQLVSENVNVVYPSTRKGQTTVQIFDVNGVREKYGMPPEFLIELKGLMGDSSDCIPGVKGVGEKTAVTLIRDFGSLEKVYEALEEGVIPGKKLNENLLRDKEAAFLSRELGRIYRTVPGIDNINDYIIKEFNNDRLYELMMKYGFKSLIDKLALRQTEHIISDKTNSVIEADSDQKLAEICDEALKAGKMSIYAEFENGLFDSSLKSLGISIDGEIGYNINVALQGEQNTLYSDLQTHEYKPDDCVIAEKLKKCLESGDVKKYGFDMKPFVLWCMCRDIRLVGLEDDVSIQAYVSDPAVGKRSFGEIAEGTAVIKAAQLSEISGDIACFIEKTAEALNECIAERNQKELYREIELPLINILANMEYIGFKIDIGALTNLQKKLADGIYDIEKEIYVLAGGEFNINSPKQLGVVLFERLQLPVIKKNKTGYSTDAAVLEELAGSHEVVNKILEYRRLTKLKSTYADGLLAVVDRKTGRLHSGFNQTITATGRLSSTEPNLQNIPVRYEAGREIRRIFVAENDEYQLIDADYSQIELRILAHMSDDAVMKAAFKSGADIHTSTAAQVFGTDESEVTPEMRSGAKAVNFGIVYGISSFGLAKELGISTKEAKEYISNYLNRFPGIKRYMDDTIEEGKNCGYVKTLFNRRRYLPELKSSNRNTQAFGERVAMNAPIQGTAADIIKIAMIRVYEKLKSENLKAELILQVHDELLIEAPKNEVDRVRTILKECMENAVELKVNLPVEVKCASSWYETK